MYKQTNLREGPVRLTLLTRSGPWENSVMLFYPLLVDSSIEKQSPSPAETLLGLFA